MAKNYFLPHAAADRQNWLKNFAAKLPTYAAKYGIAAADVTDTQNGAAFYNYWADYRNQYNEFVIKLTSYKNELGDGIDSGASAGVQPVTPIVAVAPAAVLPGIFKRATSIANVIKSKSSYVISDGNDLGIEGAQNIVNLTTMKPAIKLQLVAGGQPEIIWTKQGMDGIEISVDRGTGTFALLAFDTHPNYTDTAALPATGTSAVWKYKAIYHQGDVTVGAWSDVVSITVTGN